MFEGTTPTHIFELPIDTSLIKTVKIIYRQGENTVLIKRTEGCSVEEGRVCVRLCQEETFSFDPELPVTIQLRILTTRGDALISKPIVIRVGACLDEEVLT